MNSLGELSNDAFLGGAVVAKQPKHGYRAAMDTVLLAAAVPASASGHAIELGCGAGIASLCYAWRVKGAKTIGIDSDPAIIELARDNAETNALEDRVAFQSGQVGGDLGIQAGTADQVFANPPYLPAGATMAPPNAHRDRSMVEKDATLSDWIEAMITLARPKGGLTVVHRADRLQEILSLLQGRAGETIVVPLWPREGASAKGSSSMRARESGEVRSFIKVSSCTARRMKNAIPAKPRQFCATEMDFRSVEVLSNRSHPPT